MNYFEYKGFKGSIEYDKEYKVYHGKVQDIKDLVLYEGYSLETLEKDFHEAIDRHIELRESIKRTAIR